MLLQLKALVMALALTVPRAYICFALMPGLGAFALKGVLRFAVALAVVLPAVVPTFLDLEHTPPDLLLGVIIGFKECLIGLMLGVLFAIPTWVVNAIGTVLDRQRAALQIPNMQGGADRDGSGTGAMMVQAMVVVMMQSGLFFSIVLLVLETYAYWPVSHLSPPFEAIQAEVVMQRFGLFLTYVIVYGAPLVIPLLLIDFAFALLGVFAPTLPVSFASAPIKSIVGLLLLLFYWPWLSHYIEGDFAGTLDMLRRLQFGHA